MNLVMGRRGPPRLDTARPPAVNGCSHGMIPGREIKTKEPRPGGATRSRPPRAPADPAALAIAEPLEGERKEKGARGPLHGIPALLKNNIGPGDRMPTTAGSLPLAGSISAQDSFLARRLREAGAVLLGKANLSEWANFPSSHSSSGLSGPGGQCRNPHPLDRRPCGSTSRSGAAGFPKHLFGARRSGAGGPHPLPLL